MGGWVGLGCLMRLTEIHYVPCWMNSHFSTQLFMMYREITNIEHGMFYIHWLDRRVTILMMIPLYHQHCGSGAWQWVTPYRNVHYVNISVIWNKQSKTSSFLPHAVYYRAVLWQCTKACVTSAWRTGRAKTRRFVFSSAVSYPCCARRWSLPHFSFSAASCEWFQLTGPWRDNEQSSLQCSEWGGPVCERETELSHCFSPIARSVEKQQDDDSSKDGVLHFNKLEYHMKYYRNTRSFMLRTSSLLKAQVPPISYPIRTKHTNSLTRISALTSLLPPRTSELLLRCCQRSWRCKSSEHQQHPLECVATCVC